jgi:hypothetical protein
MASLPLKSHVLKWAPGDPGGADGFRWHAHLSSGDYEDYVVVDLSATEAAVTGLGKHELHERFPGALQRLAAERLRNDKPVPEQVLAWNAPVMLRADHFQ